MKHTLTHSVESFTDSRQSGGSGWKLEQKKTKTHTDWLLKATVTMTLVYVASWIPDRWIKWR